MAYEPQLVALAGPLLGGRLYADVLPDNPTFPCGVYQQVGGQALWFGEGVMPDHKHARVQITLWAATRAQANTLMRAIEGALCASLPKSEAIGAFTATYEDAIKKYGARQDFGLWYLDP
ncbi:MAG TPA: DUF3168 domain-containing protein [Stenotrophomonas sp.]|nr:DUF3168 domain-containing protein [Stenotrophomonas sp.]